MINLLGVAWYFHVIQRDDGRWGCRHGLHEYDDHGTVDEATQHCRLLAADAAPATVIVHHPDGFLERIDVPGGETP